MFAVSGKHTMAGAKRFVFDDGINIAPRCKSPRERLIELSAQWNDRHQPVDKRQAASACKAKVRRPRPEPLPSAIQLGVEQEAAVQIVNRYGMPGWAREIVLRISEAHGVSPLDVVTQCRRRNVVPARNEIFYLLRATASPLTGMHPTYPQVAKWLGRDHTGVLWGAAKHAHDHGLPAFSEFDYSRHSAHKRERHQRIRSIQRGEG